MSGTIKKSIQLRTGLFSSKTLEYQVRFSTRARRARIKIDVDGIEVVLPEHTPGEHAERMLRDYSDWILKKVSLFDELKRRQAARPSEVEKSLLIHGRKMKVVVDPTAGLNGRAKIRMDGNKVYLPLYGHSKAQAAEAFEKFLREEARREINALADEFARRMGTTYSRISIRDQRTRWGACSARKSLSFNWRLIMAPPEVAEYVVIHELAHLFEMNHSARFWKVVAAYCPDYKKRRLWLKHNGHLLRPDFVSLV